MIDPDNGRFTLGYDNAGRQRYVINPQNERSAFVWDNAGRMTVQRLANGTRASMTYDAANQMSRIVNYTSANAVLTDFDYARDAVGNATRTVEASGDRVTYSYDAAYQLKRERRSGANAYDTTYLYDAGGNRRAKIDSAARWYNPATGRFASEDPIGFSGGDTNLNRYVGNSPVNGTDPSGLMLIVDGSTEESLAAYDKLSETLIGKEIIDELIKSDSVYIYSREELEREVTARTAIVEAAHRMASRLKDGQLVFGPPMYLEDVKERTASALLSRILRQKVITTDCYNAVQLVYFDALRSFLGHAAFSRAYEYLSEVNKIGFNGFPYICLDFQYIPWVARYDGKGGAYAFRTFLLPGDWTAIENPGADSLWHGETLIYLGKDKDGRQMFFGHPFGILSLDEMLEKMAEEYRRQGKPGEPSPFLTTTRICVDFESYLIWGQWVPPSK